MKNKNHQPQTSSSYEAISETPVTRWEGRGRDAKHGNELYTPVTEYDSIPEVETKLINYTQELIAALDGTEQVSDVFLEGERRYDGAVDGAIYLDKSARPVRALVHELWKDMSEQSEPIASFLNIDKENWIYAMGYLPDDFHNRYLPASSLDITQMDPAYLKQQTARLRALYLHEDELSAAETLINEVETGEQSIEALDTLWQKPTRLDNKHIAIVDEVKSSGATLKIADQLLACAVPEAKIEPLFFSTPPTLRYNFYDESNDEMVPKIADSEKPLWYRDRRAEGRGGVYDPIPEYSQQSTNIQQRIGKFILSVPYAQAYQDPDSLGRAFRNDFKKLAQNFREKKVRNYIPSGKDKASYKANVERYYGISFEDWLQKRRRGETLSGAEE